MSKALTIYIIAGEASGDSLGAALMESLKKNHTSEMKFYGVGGEKMEKAGLQSLFPYHELSLMGFVEILPHIYKLLTRVEQTVEDIEAKHPDIFITIDSPGFNFRLAKKLQHLRNKGTKFVHYVAPTVWAYKPERAEKCAALYDHMLVLLPFEPPYFTKVGLSTTFVGHQAVWQGNAKPDAQNFRIKYQIDPNTPIITLLPGSRKNEIKRHMPIFAQAIMLMAQCRTLQNMVLAVPVPERLLPQIVPYFEGCPFRTLLIHEEQDKQNAIASSEAALVKSGTISLEVASLNTPMVVGYRANPLSVWMIRRMVSIKYASLLNIISKQEIVPEFIQEQCSPLALASAMTSIILSPERKGTIISQMQNIISSLQPTDNTISPSELAARTVLSL